MVALRLKQRKWREVIESCDKACELHPTYTKALYRRAQAKRNLKKFEDALADCEMALAEARKLAADTGGSAREQATAVINEIVAFVDATKAEGAHVEWPELLAQHHSSLAPIRV